MTKVQIVILLSAFCLASAADLKILVFGDSLTAGLSSTHQFFTIHHPYAIKLYELLREKLPPTTNITISNGGVSGDMVVDAMHQQLVGGRQDNMQMRLDRWLNESEVNGTRYDWVTLMGGINDIGMAIGKNASQIMSGLEKMYERISRHKARLLAMTTMSLSASDKPFFAQKEEERQKLNRLIRHWVATGSAIKDEKARPVLVDMDQLIKYTNSSTLFCVDGLHLSPEGYDKMGTEIFNGLAPYL